MALRIGQYVVHGELNNARRNSVSGWIDFGDSYGVRIALAGNLAGELAGKQFRFETNQKLIRPLPEPVDSMADEQIGVVGTCQLRMARVLRGPVEAAYLQKKAGEPLPADEKPCLYLEWFSQDGRVVAEIVEPQISYVTADGEAEAAAAEPQPLPEANESGLEITGLAINEQGDNEQGDVEEFEIEHRGQSADDDPYALFPPDLAAQVAESVGPIESDTAPRLRSWDEVIPGIDPETKRLYEQWDDITYGRKDEPLVTLFDPPLALRPPQEIENEEDAQRWLQLLLARLALHSVAIDVCEHFSALDVYRWLLEEILPEAHIHPQLRSTGFVQHYSTWESCPRCEAEFDVEYRQREDQDGGQPGG